MAQNGRANGSNGHGGDEAVAAALRPKKGAAFWSLHRIEDGKRAQCSWHANGQRANLFPVSVRPTFDRIRDMWGSGTYKVTWFDARAKLLGQALKFTVADDNHPPKPLAGGETRAAPAAPPPAAAPAATPDMAAVLATLENNRNPIALALMLMQIQRDADERAHARATQDAQLTILREEQRGRQMLHMMSEHYRAMSGRVPPREDDDEDDEDDDVRDQIAELTEGVKALAQRAESGDNGPMAAFVGHLTKVLTPELGQQLVGAAAKRLGS